MSEEPLRACVSCGGLVTQRQDPPYDGHKDDCKLVAYWNQSTLDELKVTLAGFQKEVENQMRGDVNCRKCGTDMGYGWDAKRMEVILLGGYKAVICVDCSNLWGDYVRETKEADWKALRKVETTIDATRLCFDTAGPDQVGAAALALAPLMEEKQEVKDKFYAYAKVWLADKIPTPVATTP